MDRWQIMRNWSFTDAGGDRRQVGTTQLADYGGCALLGAAGIGKTSEMRFLADHEERLGFQVRFERLAVLAAGNLENRLKSLLSGATPKSIIYLDAFDEAMIPLSTISLNLSQWIKDDLKECGAKFRISSRSAVWPRSLDSALNETYPSTVITASLEPMTDEDIKTAAMAHGISEEDFEQFKGAIARIGASALTQQPLTLEMMLRMFQVDKKLAPNRRALFEKGVIEYTKEREERREAGTATRFSSNDILEAAERLACFVLLSGRDTVDLGDNPPFTSLGLTELTELAGNPSLDQKLIEAVGNSGLCEYAGGKSFQFAHRQFAEYLAGRRLATLLPHQAQSILSSGVATENSVAGALRETASFAAMHSEALAKWISECDPDVIGISDVADESLRRQAMCGYLDRFRTRKFAARQSEVKDAQLWGFKNPSAEEDLRQVLRERGANADNLLECAIGFCESWKLTSLSDDLADLVLDTTAPYQCRKVAGYALKDFGTQDARSKLKPLIFSAADDADSNLKGLALRCNWPHNITVTELLAVLTPRRDSFASGAYEFFLFELDNQGFHANGHILEGVAWAKAFLNRQSDYDPLSRIAKRIAHAAVMDLDNPAIAAALAELLYVAHDAHADSPLGPIVITSLGAEKSVESPAPLLGNTFARRILIEALIGRAPADKFLWQVGYDTPGIWVLGDFEWLLERATNPGLPLSHRIQYGNFAGALPWIDNNTYIDGWLAAHSQIPQESRIHAPLFVGLKSKEAAAARKMSADIKKMSERPHRKKLRPAPARRVTDSLSFCETNDPKGFFGLCQELTLKEDSTHYEFERFLSRAPGWVEADDNTRNRIIKAAKAFLGIETDEPERIQSQPINSILSGYMQAIWLIFQFDNAWIEGLPTNWWNRWMLYLLRQLNLNLIDEPEEPKQIFLRLMHHKAPSEFRRIMVELATSTGQDSQQLLSSLLSGMDSIPDRDLDQQLSDALSRHVVSADRIGIIAEFVLGRDIDRALPACIRLLDRNVIATNEETAIRAAVALLFEATSEGWENVLSFMRDRPDLGPRILAQFAHNENLRHGPRTMPQGVARLKTAQVGQLVSLLLEFYPYESDPHHRGAHIVMPEDSARTLRSQLISGLSGQKDAAAVLAWRKISAQFGSRYSFLQDIEIQVERDYRLSLWSPISPASVAAILQSQKRRLIRSEIDVADGIIAAIEGYSRRLQGEGHHELESLWNTNSIPPSPKSEEHFSDVIQDEIKQYFRQYAVTTGREMQIFRRKVSKKLKGEPGSEVDVIVQIPATGSVTDQPIVVPLEVKLSRNKEAKTGLRDQLVDRYIRQAGTSVGVFVVGWMQGPKLARPDRPVWDDIAEARSELSKQIESIDLDTKGSVIVKAIVVDATLRTVAPSESQGKKSKPKKGKQHPSKTQKMGKGRSQTKENSGTRKQAKRKGANHDRKPRKS